MPTLSPTATAAELHLVIGRIARTLRQAHTTGELTLSEASTLSRLEREGPTTPGRLAEEEGVRPQAMATTLAGLDERGYLERRPDPADGRRVIVSLTPAGHAVRRERRSESTDRLAAALERLSEAERGHLAGVLPLLERLAEHL